MTTNDYTDSEKAFADLLDSLNTLKDLSSITPVDDPNYRLLLLVAENMEKSVLACAFLAR
jgi:hypothetical protein